MEFSEPLDLKFHAILRAPEESRGRPLIYMMIYILNRFDSIFLKKEIQTPNYAM